MLEKNSIHVGDCLELMESLDDHSIDMILCDLPYGSTKCAWDVVIPFELLWERYERIAKKDAAIVLTASQPFTSALVMSNVNHFKQALVWNKKKGSNPLLAKKRIMQSHEDILIFSYGKLLYNPQMSVGRPYKAPRTGGNHTNSIVGGVKKDGFKQQDNNGFRYPTSVLEYTIHCGSKLHPTQKPVELFEYLIKTFSNEGDLVLDNCAGSGTTAVACLNCNRDYILMEKESKFCEIAKNRIEK